MFSICYPLHTDSSKFRELEKICQTTCLFYQLQTAGVLLNIPLGPPNHNSQSFPKRLISLDHKPKMRWPTSGFVVILCKYELLLKKSLAMSVREVIWAVSFDSLLKPDPYVDVDDIMGYDPNWRRESVDHESASWSKDFMGHVSPIHVVERNMSLFWVLNRFTKKSIICWCGMSCQ